MIQLNNIHIHYDRTLIKQGTIIAHPGQVTLIHGPSGSGKSALLYRIGLLVLDCDVYFEGKQINTRKENIVSEIRRQDIAFVLQDNDLIDHLTVQELLYQHGLLVGKDLNQDDCFNLFKQLDLNISLHQPISSLSLGEKQRLSIGCALIKDPKIIILDEPTASLDVINKKRIFDLLKQLSNKGYYIILSSHEEIAKEYADKIYIIQDQQLIETKASDFIVEREVRPNKISKKLATFYAKSYWKNQKTLHFLSCILNVFIITALSLTNILYLNYSEQVQQNLFKQSHQYVYITKTKEDHYLDQSQNKFTLDTSAAFGLFKLKDLFNDIYILPYFDDTLSDEMIQIQMDPKSNHGIYLSSDVYQQLTQITPLQKFLSLSLSIDNQNVISYDAKIAGILRKGINQYCISQPTKFIYMYYKEYETFFDKDSYNGYIYPLEEYSDYHLLKEEFPYHFNDEPLEISKIDALTKKHQQMILIINISLTGISFLLSIILKSYIIQKRKKEIVIAKINGISNNYLFNIFNTEDWITTKYSILIIFVFSLLGLSLSKFSFIFTTAFTILVYVKSIIINYLFKRMTANINIENILRN